MKHTFLSWFAWILLLIPWSIASCTPGASMPPKATIPPGVDSQDILVDYETIAQGRRIFGTHPNGISAAVYATYEEQLAGQCCDFSIERGNPFVGQVWITNADLVAHSMAVLCLVDYVQSPCTPAATPAQFPEFTAEKVLIFPIEIPDLGEGVHDFGTLIIHEPYQDIDALTPLDLKDRAETGGFILPSALFVGDSIKTPDVNPVFPEPKPLIEGFGYLLLVTQQAEIATGPYEMPIWLSESSNPGGMIDFYLHFNDQDDPRARRRTVAVMAFLNYQQTPLYIDGREHLPLYVQREPGTCQSLAVQIQAPSQPGVYEMIIVARDYAHSRLTDKDHYFGLASPQHSQLIKLEVNPAP